MEKVDKILHILERSKHNKYIGEEISQLDHALQTAQYGRHLKPYDVEFIIACLLHDIGHQLDGEIMYYDDQDMGIKDHEKLGADFLRGLGFSEKICYLVENHVKIKRYNMSVIPEYREKLSDASMKTFILQGGIMSGNELEELRESEYFYDLILFRDCDDNGKTIGLTNLDNLETYTNMIFGLINK